MEWQLASRTFLRMQLVCWSSKLIAMQALKSYKRKGFYKAKPEHYVQMQMYMNKMKLNYGLYFAVNKNDDSIHGEIVEEDNYTSPLGESRAQRLFFQP